ncbi:hypothetical protein [Microbispora sp. ATCC PTA-5024]|uniref:hypothetical protein n=1 Tax=Microbispora sp. ATCC PTA-5024 TaxID=316330 RepID=UPI0012ECD974|nr:hypothetical protein [Microbispora sp. ATCC PTA-5024]
MLGAILASILPAVRGASGEGDGWLTPKDAFYALVAAVMAVSRARTAHRRAGVRAAVLRRRTLTREVYVEGLGVAVFAPTVAALLPALSCVAALPVAASPAGGETTVPVLALAAVPSGAALAAAGAWWIGWPAVRRCAGASVLLRVFALLAVAVVAVTVVLAEDVSLSTGWWNAVCAGLVCWAVGGGILALARAQRAAAITPRRRSVPRPTGGSCRGRRRSWPR